MQILLKRPSWGSASEMFVAAGVNTFKAVLRNLLYTFICRVDGFENEIIMALSNIKFSTSYMLPVPAVETLVQLSIYKAFVVLCILFVIVYVFYSILMFCTIWTFSLK